ncbi:MAG: hypothetical protein CMJ83_20840, partial [Planctomycetes bacterium]|nr:hypothetical protein [Planctomycetota bacterium]
PLAGVRVVAANEAPGIPARWAGTTDANGCATIPSNTVLELRGGPPFARTSFVARIAVVGTPNRSASAELDVGIRHAHLVLPFFGTLEIEVSGPGDVGMPASGEIKISRVSGGRLRTSADLTFPVANGRASVLVAPGACFAARFVSTQDDRSRAWGVGWGPSEPGGTTRLHLELALARARVLDIQLIHQYRRPFADATVWARVYEGPIAPVDYLTSTLTTGPDGRIRWIVEELLRPGDQNLVHLCCQDENGQTLQAVGRLTDWTTDGRYRRVLMLEPPPVLASGTVRDASGRPVIDAEVQVERRFPPSEWTPWSRIDNAFTDENGRFEIRSHPDARPMRLSVDSQAGILDPIPLNEAAQDLELTLPPSSILAGARLIHDDESYYGPKPVLKGPAVPRPQLFYEDLDGNAAQICGTEDSPHRLAAAGLRPGNLQIEVRSGRERRRIAVLGEVVIRAGETARPKALQRWDPKRYPDPQPLRIRTRTADGHAAPYSMFFIRPSGQPEIGWTFGTSVHDAEIEVAGAIDVMFLHHGHRMRIVENITEDADVRLEPGIPATLRTPRDLTVPDGHIIMVSLAEKLTERPPVGGATAAMWRGLALDVIPPSGVVTLRVPRPGTYDLDVRLLGPAPRVGSVAESVSLIVPDGGTQLELPITTKQVRDAARRLR